MGFYETKMLDLSHENLICILSNVLTNHLKL